jgi:hypothetical protein
MGSKVGREIIYIFLNVLKFGIRYLTAMEDGNIQK